MHVAHSPAAVKKLIEALDAHPDVPHGLVALQALCDAEDARVRKMLGDAGLLLTSL